MTALEVAADVANRIREADDESANAMTAFAVGRGNEYWRLKAEQILKRVEDAGGSAIAAVRGG